MMRLLERGYAFVGIVYYEQGIIQAVRNARGAEALKPGSSDIVSTVAQLAILLILLTLLLVRRRSYAPVIRHLLPYAAILLLCFASTAWSDNPLPTLRRSVSLASCVLFGMYLTQTFSFRGAITMAGQAAVFLGLVSVAVFVAVPKIGRETALGYETAMRGVFSQKNPMAECMLLGVSCYCFRVLDEGWRIKHLAALFALLACIALSRSATSLGIAALVLVATGFMATYRRPRMRLVFCFGVGWIALSIVALATVVPDSMMALSGRDASLTGRGPLWHEVIRVIAHRPLLGHGYAGYWNDDSREVQYLWLKAGWRAPDSHDGYLDVLVELGVVGLIAYLIMWGQVIVRGVVAMRSGGLREARWIVLFMLINVVLNLDEGPMPYSNGFALMMPGALLALGAWRGRRRVLAPLHRLTVLPLPGLAR